MTNPTSNFGWQMPTSTDLVTDLPADFEVFGQAVDTSLADLKGGTSGQVLSKNSNTDMDFVWVTSDDANAIQNTIVDAKGDLITATAADTPARLAVGTNGQTLVADSSTATGLKWATPSGGGKVLQVIQATSTTNTVSGSTTLADSGLSASITPSATSSKILVMTSQQYYKNNTSQFNGIKSALLRGATQIAFISQNMLVTDTTIFGVGCLAFHYLDSPATTSATTYKVQFANNTASTYVGVSSNATELQTMILMEIGA